ncbi:hypothetical protein B0H66DRAFT_599642 [Apodospora peruviana]|uniref:magnesium chelatase n=1 Tax=Apodospora peruviana TaxID=516989 RepID=A0AAE0MAK1_9PEZI|nr:hypothetical protein B0H66DRAFT_599642 [Apodospora peruviana]
MADANADREQQLLQKIHNLSDLELAALLCLIAREHCLISTLPDSVDELADELRLIARKTFNLSAAIVSCHAHTTLDDFATALLISPPSAPPLLGSNNNNNRNSNSSSYNTNNNNDKDTRSASPYRPPGLHDPSASHFLQLPGQTPAPAASGTVRSNGGGGGGGSIPPMSLYSSRPSYSSTQPQIANIIFAKNLDRAPKAVQIQALELLRTRRIFTRTSVQPAPKQFAFIALVGAASGGQGRVTRHLNDFFYIAHWHDPDEDGFPNLEEEETEWAATTSDGDHVYDDDDNDKASIDSGSSVVKKTPAVGSGSFSGFSPSSLSSSSLQQQQKQKQKQKQGQQSQPSHLSPLLQPSSTTRSGQDDTYYYEEAITAPPPPPLLTEIDIAHLAQLAQHVRVDVDVSRYRMNIIAFLRMHRAVDVGGVSPAATKHFDQLMRSLAPLHGLDYVTPSLVALAAKKIYLHRIIMVAAPERERSMQWGSELAAVEALLDGLGPEDVIDEVLGMVAVPY